MGRALGKSVVYLPNTGPPYPTLLDFFVGRFPKIPRATWVLRFAASKVLSEEGQPVTAGSVYRPDTRLFYYREVDTEPAVSGQEQVLFHNDHLLVACKPHFLPVTPTGPYVRETLMGRLMEKTGNPFLSPINRIDRETAGLVLVSTDKTTRGCYQRMFMEGGMGKTYLAVAHFHGNSERTEWLVENRIETGEPWFRMRISPGKVNARSLIRLLDTRGKQGLFALQPLTGRKHQLRLHLSGLGFPIVNDRTYPELLNKRSDDCRQPLQLLSQKIAFKDPISGHPMVFETARDLAHW